MYISHMVLCYSFFYLYRNIDFPAAEMQHNLLSQSTTFVDSHFNFFYHYKLCNENLYLTNPFYE